MTHKKYTGHGYPLQGVAGENRAALEINSQNYASAANDLATINVAISAKTNSRPCLPNSTPFGIQSYGRRGTLAWYGVPIPRSSRPRSLPDDRAERLAHRRTCVRLAEGLYLPADMRALFTRTELAVLSILAIEQRKAGDRVFAICQAELARRAHCSISSVYRAMHRADKVKVLALAPMARDRSRRSLPRILRFAGEAYVRVMQFAPLQHRPAPAWRASTGSKALTHRQYIKESGHSELHSRNTNDRNGLQPCFEGLRLSPQASASALVRNMTRHAPCGGGQEAADSATGGVEADRRTDEPRG